MAVALAVVQRVNSAKGWNPGTVADGPSLVDNWRADSAIADSLPPPPYVMSGVTTPPSFQDGEAFIAANHNGDGLDDYME